MNEFFVTFAYVAIGMLAGWVVRPFYEGYAKRRGELLAERGYAAELELEKVRARQPIDLQNARHKAELDIKNQLRTAAIERRLVAHQQAFALWRRLYSSQSTDQASSVVLECQQWWNENCLFLEPEARDKFSLAYLTVAGHKSMLEATEREKTLEYLQKYTRTMDAAGEALLNAVSLPKIVQDDIRGVHEPSSKP
ncbi:hypothetical protein [Achromobacter sp. PAB15]|uniref:hypothetical protein n=1 Tax=Achromobacter sp. PAB15 TaxID=3233048 RepID=UPI003F915CD1